MDAHHHFIKSYGPGWVKINETEIRHSVVVTAEQLIADWPPQTFADLEEAHFAAVARLEPEIVIVGTGARQHFPPPPQLRPLLARGIGVEIMDTAAACRTYNVIMLEGRRIAAALLMIEQ
ncbi:MAG: Mth938-like domain-containing protein [Candidatus Competibacteraceae bacterium]|nr:Mth938-like domain-containing protein [Candidatus Competibacteraceae bacterium]MBK7982298.1 Mth938-like domain-containing protein [Candidatus Competibacteraceae bacterium]MBK8899152.1 Mth938-like domain-containing protein [Candidatus Competibacteraceae bacterium]MBK8963189.1 Mth938-like domain-containing protein [Candidatus Competibacteraceae bacterium]MBK9952153.1 Mth938-like domain-containing protein [Candidatus Competibacteraceae bacterium]